jgi:hypothetical protein
MPPISHDKTTDANIDFEDQDTVWAEVEWTVERKTASVFFKDSLS